MELFILAALNLALAYYVEQSVTWSLCSDPLSLSGEMDDYKSQHNKSVMDVPVHKGAEHNGRVK